MSGATEAESATEHSVRLLVTVQEHLHTREPFWAVATVLVVDVLSGEAPQGVAPGLELEAVGGMLGKIAPGESAELAGEWAKSRRGDLQLRVQDQVSKGLQPHDATRWLERLDGVGPAKARALVRHFGDRLLAVLAGEVEADLTEVHGIAEATARHILDSYAELAISGDLESLQFLDGIGATRWEAGQILAFCARRQKRPREVLEESPYDLMGVKGLGFRKVDRLARRAGCSAEAPARLEAAVVFQLGEITQRGSTMVRLASGKGGGLVGEVGDLLNLPAESAALVREAVGRLAARGEVVIAQEPGGGAAWVHPAELLRAERLIYRFATGRIGRPSLVPREAEPARGPVVTTTRVVVVDEALEVAVPGEGPVPCLSAERDPGPGPGPTAQPEPEPKPEPASTCLTDDLAALRARGGATLTELVEAAAKHDPHSGEEW